MVVAKLPDPPPPSSSGSGSGSGSNPGTPATTATTAPARVTVAGGGSAPDAGKLVAPATPAAPTALPATIDQILNNPNTSRPRRQSGKGTKDHKTKDNQAEVAAEPSIPDWNTITDALTPEAVAAGDQPAEVSLAGGAPGHHGPRHDPVRMLLDLAAAGMIATVLSGLRRARNDSRPRPALWL
jgi:hypothetical protein